MSPYTLLSHLLFTQLKVDPEFAKVQLLKALNQIDTYQHQIPWSWIAGQLQSTYSNVPDLRLTQTLWNLTFPNPVGLAAGLDKDGLAAGMWHRLGFGFAELGTITALAQPGNPKPRLFRLPLDQAGLNRMGFNNQGSLAMALRLQERYTHGTIPIPIGINLGKSKVTPLTEAAFDYVTSFKQLKDWGSYFVINVSSPNTPGLRTLQSTDSLSSILGALQDENQMAKPLLLKIAPDLTWDNIAAILECAKTYQLSGIIATNTTTSRENLRTTHVPMTGRPLTDEAGGISGVPLRQQATEIIRFIYQHSTLPIIGVGGIFSVEDAWEKITSGASLIQLYTGWIYQGPSLAKQILQGLQAKLDRHHLNSITEARGLWFKNPQDLEEPGE